MFTRGWFRRSASSSTDCKLSALLGLFYCRRLDLSSWIFVCREERKYVDVYIQLERKGKRRYLCAQWRARGVMESGRRRERKRRCDRCPPSGWFRSSCRLSSPVSVPTVRSLSTATGRSAVCVEASSGVGVARL